jgi:PKD repeat protein
MFRLISSKIFLIFVLQWFIINGLWALDCAKIKLTTPNPQVKYCVGQDVNLTTSVENPEGGTIAYKWYFNNTVISPDVTTSNYAIPKIEKTKAGKYKCEVIVTKTGETPCTTSVEIDVVVFDQFSFDLGVDKSICPGSSTVPLSPEIQNSNTSIAYSWSSVPAGVTGTSKDITINANQIASEAVVTLTATAGNCVVSDNIKISNASNFTVSAGPDQTICKGANANLSATVSNTNGFPVSYLWTGPGGYNSSSQNIALNNVQESLSYTVKSTILKCEISRNISVNVISPKLSSSDMTIFNSEPWLKKCTSISGVIKISNAIDQSFYNLVDNYEVDWGDGTPNFISTNDNFQNEPHTYLAGFYNLNFKITTNIGCVLNQKYKVYVGNAPANPTIYKQDEADGCAPKKDYFIPKKAPKDVPGFFYEITFNDGVTYNFDYYTLPDTLYHTFTKTSCGVIDQTYGVDTYGVKITSKNACNLFGQYGNAAPIYISEPLTADLEVEKDTICVLKTDEIKNITIPGKIAIPGGCNNDYKFYWNVSPNTGWSASNSSLGTLGIDYEETESGSQNLNLIFNTPGVYQVTLNTINNGGCPNSSKTKTICVEEKPIPKFELDKLSGCAPFTPVIKDLSDVSKSCRVYRRWEILFNSTPCSAATGNYEFIDGTTRFSTVPKIKFNERGNYTIRLKLANTCDTVIYDQQIKVLGLPVVSITAIDSICLNTSVSPTLVVNPCENTISGYSWTFTGGAPNTSNVLVPGAVTYNTEGNKTIQATVKSSCGDVSATKNIYVKPLPPILNPKINGLTPSATVCIGDNANFTSADIPKTPSSFNWSGPNGYTNTNQNFSFLVDNVNQAGEYKVKGTMNGCPGPEEKVNLIVKTKPIITITPTSTSICKNTSTNLVASGTTSNTATPTWTYTWTPNTNITPTSGATVTVNPTATTTYVVTGNDGICNNSKSVVVTVKELPVIDNSVLSQSICSGGKTSVVSWSSSLPSTYRWELKSNPGNVTGTIANGTGNLSEMTLVNPTFVNQTVVYSVIPTANLCDGSPIDYSIIVKPKPDLTISPFTKTTYCGGEKISVPSFSSSVTGADYQWELTTPKPLPSSITGIPVNHAGTGQMTDLTINNNSSSPVNFTYTIKPTAASCIGDAKDFSFTIFPAPSIQDPFTTSQEICSESNTAVVPFSSATSNVKYIWTIQSIPTGLNSPSKLADSVSNATSYSIPSFNFVNSTPNPLDVNIVVKAATAGAATCPGQTKTHKITVNPKPVVNLSTINQLVCHNQSSTAINFSSTTSSNMNYSWANSNATIGLSATGTGSTIPSFLAQNNTKAIVSATVTVTPIYKTANATCNGVSNQAEIKVLPLPEVLPISSQLKCPGESTDLVTPTLNPATGSTFVWTLTGDLPSASSLTTGTGDIVSSTTENIGSTIKTGNYKVTPTFTSEGKSCVGSDLFFTIKVLPKPVLNPISNQEKCSQTNNDLVSFTTLPNTGVDIQWQNDLAIGIPASGTGNIPATTLNNTADSPITSNFTATPSFTNSGKTCAGDIKSFAIKVNPIPKVNPVSDISICPNVSQNEIPFTSNVNGTTFGWVNSGVNVGIPSTTGTGNIASFTTANTTDQVQTALIKVTPTANTCVGPSLDFKINIKPKPRITNTPLSQTVCSGDKNKEVVWSSSVSTPPPSYSWTSSPMTSGLTITPATGTGNIPGTYEFTNTGTTPISVKFTVKSTVDLCESDPTDYVLTINPRPVLENIDPKVVCSGVPYTSSAFVTNINPSTYAWQVKTNPVISSKLTGYTTSGTGAISENSVKNGDNIPLNLTYIVVPKALECEGNAKEFVVTINPTPQVSFSIDRQTICNETSNQKVTITSDPAGAAISWTATVPSNINGFTNLTGTDEVPVYTLSNTSSMPDSIKIESKANTVGVVCPGSLKAHYIIVIPKPQITPLLDITKCDNENINTIVFSGTSTSFDWENSTISTGLNALSGTGNIPGFLTTNKGISPIESVVNVTPKYNFNSKTCLGQKDEFKIIVNPRPTLDNLTPMTACNNEQFQEKLITSSITGATYSWTNSLTQIGLGASGNDKIPAFKGTNTTDDILTAKIVVTPTYTNNSIACSGVNKEVEYIVKPTARVTNLDKVDTICSGMFSKNINWTTNVDLASTSFEWKLVNTPDSVSGHDLNGIGNFKSVKILNKAKSIRKLEYKVKPTFYGCLGDTSFIYTLYINPSASLKGIDDQVICGGLSYTSPTFSSDVSSTVFKWKLRDSLLVPATIQGYLKSGVAVLPSKTIENNGTLPYTLIYDVSTDVSGCSGQSIDFKLTVNPAPKVKFDELNQTICSGTNSKLVNLSSVTPDVYFEWKINSPPDSLTGVVKTLGTNQLDIFTLQNKSTKPIDLVISAKAYTKAASKSCYGKDTSYIITTNPIAKVKEVVKQEVCHGSSTNQITLVGTGTSYHWNAKETGFGLLPTNGVDKVPAFNMNYLDTSFTKDFEFYIQPKYTHQGVTCDGILDTFYIRALPKPIISVASSTICLGKKATLKGEGAGINAIYTWSPTIGLSCTTCISPVASPDNTTEYTIIGTNRFGCKDTTTTKVFVNPLPQVNAGPDTTLCNQPIPHTMVGTVEGVVKSGFWSGSPDVTSDGIYTPKTNGVYKVVYNFILPSGCENFDTTLVTVKDVEKSNAGPDLIACFNDPDVTLNGTPKPGTWSGFNVSLDGIFKPIKDTLVQLVYTIGKGTCLNRDTMSFKVQPDFYINAGPDKEFCFSDKAFDFIDQNYEPKLPQVNGEWKGTGISDKLKGTFNPGIAGEGKHEIVFSYTHPSTGCIKYDTLIAEVHPLPIVKFKLDSIVCLNTTQTLLNQTTYLQESDWTIFPKSKYVVKNPTHKFDSVGFFDIRLIATSPFGCVDSLIKNIEVREGPVAKFTRTPDSTCGLVSFVNLSKGIGVSYDWDFGNGTHFDKRDPSDLIYKPGVIKDTTYMIQLKIENLCGVDSMRLPIVVKPVPKIIFAPNVNEGCSVLPITFANKTVGLPDELKWDLYGDGNFIEIRDSLIYRDYTTGNTSSTTYKIKVIAVNECVTDTATTQILVHPNTVKAHFNPDKLEGCTDLTVKYAQYSMGNTFHIWNFGDGTTSKDVNPTHIYKKPGIFNMYLAVNNGCSYDTMRTAIKVYKTPTVDFIKSHDSLCLKNAFSFTSITNPLDQLTYKWFFGDGDTSVSINTTHTYVQAGIYDVKLKVTNIDNYCGAEKTYKVYAKPRPVAAFEMDTMIGCSPVFVSFKNKSVGANYHSWNFGDGVLSNGIDVNHTFKANLKDTVFNVRLIVENASSCKDTVMGSVRVFPVPIIKYSYTPTDQCYTPMYADFTNQSIGAQTYKWFFHDGITSLEMNPRMEYQIAGKYYVKLEGKNEFGCIDSVVHDVVKYPKPKAIFNVDKNADCIPANFTFTNVSEGASKYYWDFGNGNAKNTKDVTFEYTKDGKYDVRLIVENSDKCKDTMVIPVIAHPIPVTDFSYESTDSCFSPMNTSFTNKSIGAQFYEWDFKNGLVSSLTNPTSTFTNAGQYLVSLKATNEFNCSVLKERMITLLQKPKAAFKVDIDQGCIPLLVTFTNESDFSDYYTWDFADGNISSQKDTKNMFRFSGVDEKQEFKVSLIVEGKNGCKDTVDRIITSFPLPESKFKYTTTDPCYNPMLATFENQSLYAKKYEWRFGDGTSSTLTNPFLTYTKTGVYTVDLITTNKFNCNDTLSKVIRMLQKPDASFTMDKLNGCIPLGVNFTNTSQFSFLNYWNFDDVNTSVEVSPNHLFSKVGELTIQLISESVDKCKDTIFQKITTYPLPVPNFTYTTTDPCYIPMNAMLQNTSTGATGYKWNLGNGNTSTWVNPVEQYNATGTYKVTLEAINEYQCTATKSDNIVVKNIPTANFNSDLMDGCMPLNVNFFNLSTGFKYSSWDFGDANSSNDINGNHTFTKDGIFTIRLISENVEGCTDTIFKNITVYPLPHADFGYVNSDPCYSPMNVQMTNKSYGAVGYDWVFSNGQTSTSTHPSTSFEKGGNHLLSMVAKNEFGCKDDTAQVVISYNPPNIKSATFSDEECQYDQSKFSVEGEYISKYTWDMGDGILNEGSDFNYAYTKDGLFDITIYAEGEGNCKDTLKVTQKIKIKKDPRAAFEAINILIDGKKNGTIEFDNQSKFANKYYWDFGDGDTSSAKSPIHKYYNSGNYQTTLITYNQYNCVDTIIMDIKVDFFKGLYVPNAMYLGHQNPEVSQFLPKGVGLFKYELTIYDDWGNLIWKTTEIDEQGRPTQPWDGKFNDEYVQQDSYVWKVEAIFKDDSVWIGKEYEPTVYKRSGTVTVIK